MSNPTLPPYLGSWEDLVRALMHDPFLGGGRPHQTHLEATRNGQSDPLGMSSGLSEELEMPPRLEPEPSPWFGVSMILSVIAQKQIVERLPEGNTRKEMMTAVQSALADEIDDWCPTRPHPHWPHGWSLLVAAQLGAIAQRLPEGRLQSDILQAARQGMQNALGGGGARAAVGAGAAFSAREG